MRRSARRKRSNKVRSDIVFRTARRDRVTEDASADFPSTVRSIDDAFGFDSLQDLEEVRCLNRSNRFAPEVRNHPLVVLLPIPRLGRLRERSVLRQQPLIGYG